MLIIPGLLYSQLHVSLDVWHGHSCCLSPLFLVRCYFCEGVFQNMSGIFSKRVRCLFNPNCDAKVPAQAGSSGDHLWNNESLWYLLCPLYSACFYVTVLSKLLESLYWVKIIVSLKESLKTQQTPLKNLFYLSSSERVVPFLSHPVLPVLLLPDERQLFSPNAICRSVDLSF